MMKRNSILRTLALALVMTLGVGAFSVASVAVSSEAAAQSRSLTTGPVVRRQLLYRSSKLELSPMISAMFNNSYQVPVYAGLTFRYHLTNAVALGVDLNASPVAWNRRVLRDLKREDQELFREVDVANSPLLFNFHISYAPITGKFNLLGNNIAHFDFHIVAGAGGALQSADSSSLSGMHFGGVIGAGVRVFVSDGVAITTRVTDYIYPNGEAVRGVGAADERWRQHYVVGMGVSFFFPKSVYVSR